MAATIEIDSFFVKFKHLWNNGFAAKLDLKAEGGRASIVLSLDVEDSRNLNSRFTSRHSARDRRRFRRKLQRKNGSESEDGAAEVNEIKEEENYSKANVDLVQDHENLDDVVVSDSLVTEEVASVSFTELESEEVNLSTENITEEVVQDLLVVQEGAKQQSSSEIDDDFKQSVVPEKIDEKVCEDSSFARVYALATFHSENDHFMETDKAALRNILRSRDHLRKNIAAVSYGPIITNKDYTGNFKHSIQIIIHVDITHLWENARNYIYHHLGREDWVLGNGTVIKLSRIHTKKNS